MISVHSLIWEPVALALLYASTHSQLGKGSTQLLKPTEMPTILKSIGTLENKERGLQKGPLTFKKKKKVRKSFYFIKIYLTIIEGCMPCRTWRGPCRKTKSRLSLTRSSRCPKPEAVYARTELDPSACTRRALRKRGNHFM